MLVNEKFKQMREFKRVHIAKPADLFARVGMRENVPSPSSEDTIPMNLSKNDMLAYISDYDRELEREHHRQQSAQNESSVVDNSGDSSSE